RAGRRRAPLTVRASGRDLVDPAGRPDRRAAVRPAPWPAPGGRGTQRAVAAQPAGAAEGRAPPASAAAARGIPRAVGRRRTTCHTPHWPGGYGVSHGWREQAFMAHLRGRTESGTSPLSSPIVLTLQEHAGRPGGGLDSMRGRATITPAPPHPH